MTATIIGYFEIDSITKLEHATMSPLAKTIIGYLAAIISILITVLALITAPQTIADAADAIPWWIRLLASTPPWALPILIIALFSFATWALWPDFTLQKRLKTAEKEVWALRNSFEVQRELFGEVQHQFAMAKNEIAVLRASVEKCEQENHAWATRSVTASDQAIQRCIMFETQLEQAEARISGDSRKASEDLRRLNVDLLAKLDDRFIHYYGELSDGRSKARD